MPELQLRVIVDGETLNTAAALRIAQRDTVEAFLQSILLLPLDPNDLFRIQLGTCFRDAMQSARRRKPVNIIPILKAAKTLETDSLESKIWKQAGTRGLVGFAAAAQKNRQVVQWMKALKDDELEAFLSSTTLIEVHEDFSRIVQHVDYSVSIQPDKIPDKAKHVLGPRTWKRPRLATEPSPGEFQVMLTAGIVT
jgi:hypothetical protein